VEAAVLSSHPAPSRRAVLWSAVGALVVVGVVAPHLARAAAQTYHVDPSGSDANPGTSGQPFQHIQKCADVMVAGDTCLIGSGRYRETVRPKNSGTGTKDTTTAPYTYTTTAPITYAPEPGATVTVDGSDPVSGAWSQVTSLPGTVNGVPDPMLSLSPFASSVASGKVYSAHVSIPQPLMGANVLGIARTSNEPPPQVFYNGKMMMTAQWPPAPSSHDPMHPTIQVAGDGTTATTIGDPALTQPPGYWVGAQVYISQGTWMQTAQVVASAPGSLTVCCTVTAPGSNAQKHAPEDTPWPFSSGGNVACLNHPNNLTGMPLSVRYFLYNKLENVAGPGDWFYDSSAETLYFYSPTGAPPAAGAVTVKQRQDAFDLDQSNASGTNTSHTTIQDINVFGSTIRMGAASVANTLDGVSVNYPSYFTDMDGGGPDQPGFPTLQDCMATGAFNSGVVVRGNGNVMKNSAVTNSAGNGVLLWGTNEVCPPLCDGEAEPEPGNTVTNSVIRNVGFAGAFPTAAVYPIGDNNTITHNTMSGCGQACIEMQTISGVEMYNLRIAYNDISHYGLLRLDGGAIYALGAIDFEGSRVDHNWVHDAEPMPGLQDLATMGIYFDGGAFNLQIDNNVGWNNVKGLLGIVAGHTAATPGYGIKVFNNDGGGFINVEQNGCEVAATKTNCSVIQNNLGFLSQMTATDPNITIADNLPASAPKPATIEAVPRTDPLYLDPRVNDYRLQAGSPARGAGVAIPGVTDGSTDPNPSMGAYQYGAPRWVPGAEAEDQSVVLHYGASSGTSTNPPCTLPTPPPCGWSMPQNAALHRTNDPVVFTSNMTAVATAANGDLRLNYVNPVADPTDPLFADLSNLAIDDVHVRVYLRAWDHLGSVANVTATAAGLGTVWDSGGVSSDMAYAGFKVDLSDQVAGDWSKLPSWINFHGTITAPSAGGGALGSWTSALWMHGAEVFVTAHCINPAAAPCAGVGTTPTGTAMYAGRSGRTQGAPVGARG